MRQYLVVGCISLALLLLTSCATKEPGSATAPHVTVLMRDGTSYVGTVASSSPTELTITGDDKVNRTLAMKDVKSIEYDEAVSTPAPAASTPAPAAPGRPAAAARRPRPDISHENHPHPAETAISTKTFTLPVGTRVPVRVEETIDSAKAVEGQTFAADVSEDVMDGNGDVVIPRGANAQIVIRSVSQGGKIKGTSDLVLDLASVSVDGRRYLLSTADLQEKGKAGLGANKRTATYTGGGAAIGAIIGAIAGHGKGAAIGAASGAAAGAATQVITKGGSIKVPVETILTFQLDKPLGIVAR
jgi:hypothetical protein